MIGNYWRAFEPAPDIGLAEYSIRKIFNEEERPFDFWAFPHMVGVGGPMDAFDSLTIREIAMQWASRLGKTFIVLCGSLYMADLAPCNQILAGHVEDLGLQQTERVRLMGMQIPSLANTGLEKTQKKRLRFGGNTIYAAWARSPGTLSNINALYGGASELDLWEKVSTSKHPDPEEMFRDRFKDNDSSRKVIFESIPTLKGTYEDENGKEHPRSRIEAKRLQGSDCRFWVGCVHCGGRQILAIERVSADGYQCDQCDKMISDEHRKAFVRSGVWAPRGCTVDPDKASAAAKQRLDLLEQASELAEGDEELTQLREQLRWRDWKNTDYLIGTPEKDGELATYQLSSLYALSLTWRRIAEEKSDSQNFVNQWLGETAEVIEPDEIDIEEEARTLAHAITGELERNTLPDWAEFIVLTCDRQARTFPWQISAWDDEIQRVQIVDAGDVLSFSEVEALIQRTYGKRRLSLALVDSGYLASETYDWCLEMTQKYKLKVWPVKGEKASVVKLHYKLFGVEDEKGGKAKYRKLKRVHVNTQSTQEWLVKLLADRLLIRLWKAKPERHQELCEQLINEQETILRASRTWDRIHTGKPNDQRDDLRYGFVGAQLAKKLKLNQEQQSAAMVPTDKESEGFIRRREPTSTGGFIRRRS